MGDMKDVTVFMLIDSLAAEYECMPEKIQKANIEVSNKLFSLSEEFDFEKQALESTRFLLESEVGKLYTDKYFSEELKAETTKLVMDVRSAEKTRAFMELKRKKQLKTIRRAGKNRSSKAPKDQNGNIF